MPARIATARGPAAFMCGTPGPATCNILETACDIAAANCDTDFAMATTPVFYANFPGGHLGILTPGLSTNITEITTAWLRFHLIGDTTLAVRFIGPSCSYCSDPDWQVRPKNL